jgi:diacylglycerol kinase family enzyme
VRCLIIHNVDAGFGSDAIFEFERSLVREGDECTLRVIGEGFTATEATRGAEDFDVTVVSGGDGTVASLLYALRDRPVRTCVFPSGTANLLFDNIGGAPEPSVIARSCRAGQTAATDLGEISWRGADGEEHVRGFSLMAGSGYDAEIMQAAIPNKRAMGEAAYFLAALSDPTPAVAHFSLDLDGKHVERDGIACLVANNAMIQGDIEIVPDCRMDDGLLDVIVLETSDSTQLLKPLFAGVLDPKGKGLGRPHIEGFKAARVRVGISIPIPLQVDGDPAAESVSSYEARALRGVNTLVVDRMSPYYPSADEPPLFDGTDEMAYPKD